jgi:hypothetical protein
MARSGEPRDIRLLGGQSVRDPAACQAHMRVICA